MAERLVYLVRHGAYGPEGNHDPKLGYGLTVLGVKQARATAKRFKNLPVTAIHASSALRAAETAAIIAEQMPQVPFRTTSMLCEAMPCVPRGVTLNPAEWPTKGITRDHKRAEKALERYFKRAQGEDKHDVIVAHGNIIRYMICRLLNVDATVWASLDMCNCGISVILIRQDGVKILLCHNDLGHLPNQLRRYLSRT